jgi:hypothetical protein
VTRCAGRGRAGACGWRAACAERPRTAASSRRDAVSVSIWCAHGRKRCEQAITWAVRMRGDRAELGGRWAVRNHFAPERRVRCSNGCRRDKGRCMSTWTRAPLPDGERMLTCLGPIGATCSIRGAASIRPNPRRLERRPQRSLAGRLSLPRALAQPESSCLSAAYINYRVPHTAILPGDLEPSRHYCRGSRCTSSPALGHIPRESEHHHYLGTMESPPRTTTPRRFLRSTRVCGLPLRPSAAHIRFIYRPSEALYTPPPRVAYSPTSGVSVGRALIPCHAPTDSRAFLRHEERALARGTFYRH